NLALLEAFAQTTPGLILVLPAATPTTAIEIQRESSALLLINDHIYEGVVPLKTYDYLCAPRPILVFGRGGGAAQIVQELGAGLVSDVGDADGFTAALETMMSDDPARWNTVERQTWSARQRSEER